MEDQKLKGLDILHENGPNASSSSGTMSSSLQRRPTHSSNVSLNGGAHEPSPRVDARFLDEQPLESAFRNLSFTDRSGTLPSSPSFAPHREEFFPNGSGYLEVLDEPEKMFATYQTFPSSAHQMLNSVVPSNRMERITYTMQAQNGYEQSHQNHRNGLLQLSNSPSTSTSSLILTSNPSERLQGFQDPYLNYAAANSDFQNLYLNYSAVNSDNNYNQLGTDLMNDNHYGYYGQGLCREGEGLGIHHGKNVACPHAASLWSNGFKNVTSQIGQTDDRACSSSCSTSRSPKRYWYPLSGNSRHDLKQYQEHNLAGSVWFPPLGNPRHDSIPHQEFSSAQSFRFAPSVNCRHALRPQQEYNSLDEVEREICCLAKEHDGCLFLQKIVTEGTVEDVQKIINKLMGHIIELSCHPTGNYLVKNILEVCSYNQRKVIVNELTNEPGKLAHISCNMHGTRVVQKVIARIEGTDEVSWVVSALRPYAITLMMDENGSHVVENCLQVVLPNLKEFLLDVAHHCCIDLAIDRKGCCVLQNCINNSNGEQKERLVNAVASNVRALSDDTYGNYAVQCALEQKIPSATSTMLNNLRGHHVSFSTRKYASNVVEKCLRFAGRDNCEDIIRELINSPDFPLIAQDQYGNYVIQTALAVSTGSLRAALVNAIRPHIAALRISPYGKRVLSAAGLKNK